jgi:tetratricopeptide (TPR) repeat protein
MPDRILQFRPHWIDLAAVWFCVCPMGASLANGLGPYDGFSTILNQVVTWGLPYLVGRIHFNDERSLRDLMIGIVAAALIYVPFCLWEIRMSPTLLYKIYGFTTHVVEARLGGWRPKVFLNSGLELGMWMCGALLAAIWLWRYGVLRTLAGYPFGTFWLPVLGVTTLLCRASGATALLAAGLGGLWLSARFNRRLPMAALAAVPLLYVAVRIPNLWDYTGVVQFISRNFSEDRAQSLEFRFQNEDVLIGKAMQQPIFGWGGWGRSRVLDESGKDLTVTDGLWVIYLGQLGIVGLAGFLGFFLLPSCVFLWRFSPRKWKEYGLVAQSTAAAIMVIYSIDSLLNAFVNGVYLVTLGGLASCLQAGPASFAEYVGGGSRREEEVGAGDDGRPVPVGRGVSLADRYIETARNFRSAGAYGDAAVAWRHAYELLADQCTINPDDKLAGRRLSDCANDLAWFLLSRPNPEPGERAEAVRLARHASQADPGNANYLNTLAAAHVRAGEDEAAIIAVDHILALEETLSGLEFAVLAVAHARQGRAEPAAQWLEEARAWRERNQARNATLDELIEEAEAVVVS